MRLLRKDEDEDLVMGEALMDTNKMRELKELAEAAGSDEWYAAGDLRYCDDKTGETHGLHHDDSRFIAAASPATVLALLAEIESTEARLHDVAVLCATVEQERDQLKAENEALREDLALAKQAPLYSTRQDAKRYRWLRDEDYLHNWADVHVCDEQRRAEIVNRTIDAVMAKEASHG